MKFLTLSWDDGFLKSSKKTIEIFNKYDLRGEFNVVAGFALEESNQEFADFHFWNDAIRQGHVVQPHGLNHSNLGEMPFDDAIKNIHNCFRLFERHLLGFDLNNTIFNFPYNSSNDELEAYFLEKSICFRTGNRPAINKIPNGNTLKLTTDGAMEAEVLLDKYLNDLYQVEEGWLIYNTHGLDGEGFGPLGSYFLEKKLEEVLGKGDIEILPAIDVLNRYREK